MPDRRCWLGHTWRSPWTYLTTRALINDEGDNIRHNRFYVTECVRCGTPKSKKVRA